MIDNLSDCFNKEYQFYLESINFHRIEADNPSNQIQLNCEDHVKSSVSNRTVNLNLTRTVSFTPENLFSLAITFGAILTIKEDKYQDYDWKTINLADEFRHNGNFVMDNLMSRITLLIAEITSSFGQHPLILPPAGTQPLVK